MSLRQSKVRYPMHSPKKRGPFRAPLIGGSALALLASIGAGQAPDCSLINGVLPAGCTQENAGLVVAMPVGEQASEVAPPPVFSDQGFSVRINGEDIIEDARVENVARRVDVALAEANVQVVFDGLGAAPRLDVEIVGQPRAYEAGDQVVLQSALNYPAYVQRGEMRLLDMAGPVGRRVVGVIPVDPNGQVAVALPQGTELYVIHRVYDAQGRYDETQPVPLSRPDTRARADGVEDGANSMARSRIPVYGGAITVSGRDVVPGAAVRALGENIRPDASGGFVIQRIVPAGTYDVDVAINGNGQRPFAETRRVEVPRSEWFYAGIADLTYGLRRDRGSESWESYDRGRFAFYLDGRTQAGVEITASLDTGEGPLGDLFRDLDEKDPASILARLDPADLYPTYGDDSTIVDNTPTSGKIYLRVEQAGNYVLWGNFDSYLGGNSFVRSERTLYGLQGHYATQDTRANGEAVGSLDLYAAQPDRLPQRDVFRGTGGSVYFLERQDIGVGSETITVQLRDPVTGRVLGSTVLRAGVDYDLNYIQGIVTLAQPLSGAMLSDELITDASNDADMHLIVQYEYTPTSTDIDGFSYGARAEYWASDTLRFGVSGLVEDDGLAEQQLSGVDLRYQPTDNSWLQIDYAHSSGPGFGSAYSADGGLIFETRAPNAGSGRAIKLEAQADLADLGVFGSANGQISGYFEERELGFSNLDHTVDASTGDETSWGLALQVEPSDRLTYAFEVERYENAVGNQEDSASARVDYMASSEVTLAVELEHLRRVDPSNAAGNGTRTSLGARLAYAFSDEAQIYVYGQTALQLSGLERNDRLGFGGAYRWGNGWSLEADFSDGSQGQAARLLAAYDDGLGTRYYTGYELEAERELSGVMLDGRDLGQFVTGGQRELNDDLRIFGENTFDLFGRHQSLTSAYGLNYVANDSTQYSLAFETGEIQDGSAYDFERYAFSLGVSYQTETTSLAGRLEYRIDEGLFDGRQVAADTLFLAGDMRHEFSDEARMVASLEYAQSDTDQGDLLNGEYGEFVLGYAFRPIMDDRLNVLARYRYLYDMYGQRVDGQDENGPRQRSHVLSMNAIYDLDENWSLAGKLGYRFSETAADETSPFVQNDAYLIAASLTYHLVHEWDAMLELRNFTTVQAGTSETSALLMGYRQIGNNFKLGLGYNFGSFSDDLTDLVQDDEGIFVNLVAKF